MSYVLAWDYEGATVNADGSWSVVTDLGYEITITEGHLTTFSATLVSCPHSHGILDRIFGVFSPAVAWAGHSTAEDPALVGGPIRQSIVDGTVTDLGTVTVHEPSYCEGHTNWGSGNLLEDDGLAVPTLALVGTWQAPDSTDLHAFTVSSALNWGSKTALEDDDLGAVYAETGPDPISIQIARGLATSFDGIDFVTADEQDIAMSFLRSVAAATHFDVVAGTVHRA